MATVFNRSIPGAEMRLYLELVVSLILAGGIISGAQAQEADWKANLDAGIKAYNTQNYANAIENLRLAVSKCETSAPDSPEFATSLSWLGSAYQSQGRYTEAEPLFKRCLDIREKKLGPDHPDVAKSLINLAALFRTQGRYADAEPLFKRSLDIRERKLGPDHPDVAIALNNLAFLYQSQGRYADAEPLYKRSLDIREKKLGPDHPDVATAVNNLAVLYTFQGRYADAEPLFKRSLGIYEKKLGPDHPDVATSLDSLAVLYSSQGRYADAEPLFRRSLGIYEKKLGTDHPDVAASLNNLATLYQFQGHYADAEPLFKRSLDIREKKLGPDHPDVAQSLLNLALLYQFQGRYADAEPLFKRSLGVYERKLGLDHPDVASALSNLASLYLAQGRYADAEPLYNRALVINEKYGASPLAARGFALKALAMREEIMSSAGNNVSRNSSTAGSAAHDVQDNQVPKLLSLLKVREVSFGANSPEVGGVKLEFALRLVSIGGSGKKFAQESLVLLKPLAVSLVRDAANSDSNNNSSQQSVSITQPIKRIGGERYSLHKVSTMMLCLSYLLADAGLEEDANAAANLCLKCLNEIGKKNATAHDVEQLLAVASYFETQAQYASCKDALNEAVTISTDLKNNALLYKSMLLLARVDMDEGDYMSALTVSSEALQNVQSQPNTHLSSAEALDLLADCNEALGRTDEAIKNAQKSLKAKDPTGSGTQIDLLPTLLTLGELHLSQKDYESAKRELQRAVSIAEPLKGTTERTIKAATYTAEGDLELAQGNLDQARLWYNKARDINFHGDGKFLAFSHNLNSLARVDALQNNMPSARSNVLWASSLLSKYADTSFGQLSFAEQCAFVDSLYDQSDLFLSTCTDAVSLPQAYGYMMKWKGLLIESLRRRTTLSKAAVSNPEVQRLVEQLTADHRQLKILGDQVTNSTDARKQQDANITRLTTESEGLERLISQRSGGIEVLDPIAKKGAADLQKLLSNEEALVDIIGYTNPLTNKDGYAAIVMTHDLSPVLTTMGDADSLNQAISAWLRTAEVVGRPKRDVVFVSEFVSENTAGADKRGAETESDARKQLRQLLWEPIAAKMPPQIRKIWLCPDSDTAIIPWAIFAHGTQTQICTIDSPREFVSLKVTKKDSALSTQLLLAAGITFGGTTPDLPGTRAEFKAIKGVADQAKITVQPFSGTGATEHAITVALPTSTYVHFATHGFYSGSSSGGGRGVKARGTRSLRHTRQARGESSYLIDARNPLMSSGLLLSGGQISGDTTGEGKFTADEIVGLDLHKCNLVTLSACETGLGKKMSGQGVIGLRSAILGAGAHSILMSLWKVDDDATCQLMTEFYTNILANHLSPVDSLSRAQETVRKVAKWEHPYYWAGWVLAGDGWQ